MSESQAQSFANHGKIVPLYHFGISLILLANLLWSGWRMVSAPEVDTVLNLLVAVALIGLFWYARIFPLTVQDRVIRLEMRLRLQQILSADLRTRIDELGRGQLVALRFAGDGEMEELVQWVLDENVKDQKSIKQRIKDWQGDHLRC